MSRKVNCYDDALAENFFGHLKSELFHHNRFDTVEAFTTALDESSAGTTTNDLDNSRA